MKSEAEKFQMEHAGLVARSTQGHAAKGMKIKDQEDMWVSIQHNTFKNWVNVQLRESGLKVEDLSTDLMDGMALVTLVEVLQQRKLKKITKVINQHQALENVTTALNAISEDGIKLVNIGNVDIVNGNLKLILGLIWSLIMHYQIGQMKFPPKKLMLAWLKSVLPDCKVSNFTTDWNSGKNLSALIDYCKPGLFSSWKNISTRDPVQNCKKAMHIASKEFHIPMVLEPEYLASPYLDDLSGMTYLSYFMKEGGPGYNATLKWVQQQLPNKNIKNFTTNWNDGTNLSTLVKNLGGPVKGFKKMSPSPNKWENNLTAAMIAGEKLGVAPVLSAQDMARPDVSHLGPMTYISYFQWVKPRQCPTDNVKISCNVDHVRVGNPVSFNVEILSKEVYSKDLKVDVYGPANTVKVDLDLGSRGGRGSFVPADVGFYEIKVTHDGEQVEGSPIKVRALPDVSKIMFAGIDPCALGSIVEVLINSNGAGSGEIEVEAISPTGRMLACPVKEELGVYAATFQPDEAGKWSIGVTYDEEHIQGSPFTCFVYDPNAIKIRNLDDGPGWTPGRQFILLLDATACGQGEVKVDVSHNGKSIPSKTLEVDNSYYEVLFLPLEAARYKIYVYFSGHEVRGSPFSLYVGMAKPPERKSKAKKISKHKNSKVSEPIIKEYSSKIDSPARYAMNNSSSLVNKTYDAPSSHWKNSYSTLDESKLNSTKNTSTYQNSDYYRSLDSKRSHSKDVNDEWSTNTFPSSYKHASTNKKVGNSTSNYNSNSMYNSEFRHERSTSPLNRSATFDKDDKRGLKLFLKEKSPELNDRPLYDLSPSRTNKLTSREDSSQKYTTRSEESRFSSSYKSFDRSVNESPSSPRSPRAIKNYSDAGMISGPLIDSSSILHPSHQSYVPDQHKNLSSPAKVLEISQNAAKTSEDRGWSTFSMESTSSRVFVMGDAIRHFPAGKISSFDISAAGASEKDIQIQIVNPSKRPVSYQLRETSEELYTVSFITSEVGSYVVEVLFAGQRVQGSPFIAKAYDAGLIRVSDVPNGVVRQPCQFRVDASQAGEGQLEISINDGEVPNHVQVLGGGRCLVSFTPDIAKTHTIDIKFNGEAVRGCPFLCKVSDTSRVTLTLRHLELIPVGQPAAFNISVDGGGSAELTVTVRTPSHATLPVRISGNVRQGFSAEFVPTEVGAHTIIVNFNDSTVSGTPFTSKVYDSSKVGVSHLPRGAIGKSLQFIVDASEAGEGNLEISISAADRNIPTQVHPQGSARFAVSFIPLEAIDHIISISFNKEPVAGSPFNAKIQADPNRIAVSGQALAATALGKTSFFTISNVTGSVEDVEVSVEGNSHKAHRTF